MFNLGFLKFYHSRLCHELRQLFDEDQSAIECFFHQEYQFRGGETGHLGKPGVPLSLSESIRYNKKLKFAKLKADKLPIPADILPVFDETEF